MSLEVPEEDREIFKTIVRTHIESDFIPASHLNLELYGYGMLDSEGRYKKLLLSDLDGVWTKTTLFAGYLRALSEVNKGVKANFRNIVNEVSNLTPENFEEVTEAVSKLFREFGVTLSQHEHACEKSIESTSYSHGLKECIDEILRMNYKIYFVSGSPDLAVKKFVGEILELDERSAIGSAYEFDGQSFVEIKPLLYKNKRPVSIEIRKREFDFDKSLSVVISDEIEDYEMAEDFPNPMILTKTVECYQDGVFVELEDFETNPQMLPDVLRKLERGMCMYFGYTKSERGNILGSALNIGRCYEALIQEPAYEKMLLLKDELLVHYNHYKASAAKLFPAIFSEIEDFAYTLENSADELSISKALGEFWTEFTKYSPDFHVAEKFFTLRELEKVLL